MSRFKKGDVEDWVDGAEDVGKPEGVELTARLTDDFIWAKVLLR